jgi:hypothetical protein
MKKSREINNFHNELLLQFESMELILNDYKKKIKKEYQQLLIEEKNILISKIADGENLNISDLKNKYLKPKEIIITEPTKMQINQENEDLLDKIVIDDIVYYYENKEKGKVFDIKNNEVGIFKNGSILFSINK